ncbi:MAG: flagellar protein [Lachnospiraceae bacterium]|jgi:flagellar operon protein|nr:flagellar protein [Lachnospiraceae bacterium]MBQ8666519.1 flagellar protein [Lachnospiraceae bacterium]
MKVLSGQFPSIEQAANDYLEKGSGSEVVRKGTRSFADVLEDKQKEVSVPKFSKHAVNRLSERNIEISEGLMERLSAGMQAAGQKGINESLVMVDQLAFIVNVKNQTVITALDGNETDQNVFTNIDGAVIA